MRTRNLQTEDVNHCSSKTFVQLSMKIHRDDIIQRKINLMSSATVSVWYTGCKMKTNILLTRAIGEKLFFEKINTFL